jgi:hypothetical protein
MKTVFKGIAVFTIAGFLFTTYTSAGSEFDEPVNKRFSAIKQYEKIEKSKTGLEKYKNEKKAKNVMLKKEKVKDILTTVTFSKPINQKDLSKLIEKNKLDKVHQIQARFLSDTGERITMSTKYSSDAQMTEEIEGVLEKLGNAEFTGYTDMSVTVDYSALDSIEKEDFVYLADTSGDSYFTKEKDGDNPHPLTWDLEDYNH